MEICAMQDVSHNEKKKYITENNKVLDVLDVSLDKKIHHSGFALYGLY